MSKLIEQIEYAQLIEHLKTNGLYELFQSAYREFHSTETALLRVQNDILKSVDESGGAILVLLDLSAAFDTIDHEKLLHLLDSTFGVRDSALDWIRSYLSERKQSVLISGKRSEEVKLSFGVPQGSVLGPILFTIYTTPLGNLIRKHGLKFHLYADDTQLYLAFKPTHPMSKHDAKLKLEQCIEDIRKWMAENLLKLNDDKSEILIITAHDHTSKEHNITLNIGGCHVSPGTEPPRNLGVLFDSTMGLKHHINKLCRSLNYNIYSIGKIRKYLNKSATETLVNAIVTSKMDYCNSLLYGIKESQLDQLQRCQNSAARVVTLTRKREHISPVLKNLHWLPVRRRIDFKVLLITYKCMNNEAPDYLQELLKKYVPKRSLRSENQNLLVVPKGELKYFGRRAFQYVAPCLWNNLPLEIRQAPSTNSFKSMLKTHFFRLSYSC